VKSVDAPINEVVALAARGWYARRTGPYTRFKSSRAMLAQWDLSGPCPKCNSPMGALTLSSRSKISFIEPPECCDHSPAGVGHI
jgi:hypothetical protein